MNANGTTAAKILIVEDEFIVAMDLADKLAELGYAVAGQADTADDALTAIERFRPDLVLMDIQLKGPVDGVVAAEAIRERWSIPVVFVTANTSGDTLARAKVSGPFGFVSKPFRTGELDATIGIALNQHRLNRELFDERGWLTSMMGSLSDGVIAADADGLVRYMNPAAEALLQRSADSAFGLPVEAVCPLKTLESAPLPGGPLHRALATREPASKERFLVQVNGDHWRAVEGSAAPIVRDGHLIGAVTVFMDIAERLAAERSEMLALERLQEQVVTTHMALGDSQQELQALSHHLMTAQEEERARIARELHDDLGQRSALLGMKLQGIEAGSPEELRPQIASVQRDLLDLSNGLREVSHRLHPAVIADLGLEAALDSLVGDFLRSGLAVEAALEQVPWLPLEVATALFRIAQQALQNVQRHAPHALACVRLRVADGAVVLSVEDDGPGFSRADVRQKGGLGLLSMQERARLVGAEFSLGGGPGEGTTVTVRAAPGQGHTD